jgi:hypothetical protein
MLASLMQGGPADLGDRLRDASIASAALLHEVIEKACHRFAPEVPTARTARIERLIAMNAWTEAALALVELELPQWRLRRIAYDGGEWHCALSRERELPDWLDESIEAHHRDLALAILGALIEARDLAAAPSVPRLRSEIDLLAEPMCCDNFA